MRSKEVIEPRLVGCTHAITTRDRICWYVPVELHSSQNPQPGGNCSSRSRALHPPLQLLHQAGSCLQNLLLQLLRGPHRFLVASSTRAGGGVSSQLHGVIMAQLSKCQPALLLLCCYCAAAMLMMCCGQCTSMQLPCCCQAAAMLLHCCCTAAAASGLCTSAASQLQRHRRPGWPLGRCHCSSEDGAGPLVLGAGCPHSAEQWLSEGPLLSTDVAPSTQ
jgi:hypothetical protein